jgi:lipopolysaccharide biosynthesis glycosyltransferase
LRVPELGGSLLAYARFLVTKFVDESHCFYFDTDTVFFESPAPLIAGARAEPSAPLWATRNFPVSDFAQQIGHQAPLIAEGPPGDEAGRDAEAAPPSLYFNSGVMLINVGEWRRRKIPDACIALVEKHQFVAHDQDALNCVLRGQWRELPERWNYQLYERHEWPADCALLHYSGRNKPWHCGYPSGARKPFRDALAAAGWPHWRPPTNFSQWLRNTRLRPVLAQAQYRARRAVGLEGIRRR